MKSDYTLPKIPKMINEENIIIAYEQERTPFAVLSDQFCEEQAFLHLSPMCKFGYKALPETLISPAQYFNQSVYEQDHLVSSINFDMQKWN